MASTLGTAVNDDHISDALCAMHCLVAYAKAGKLEGHLCPANCGSEAFHLYRSILYMLSGLPSDVHRDLTDALFGGPGAYFCAGGSCGTPACGFAEVDWYAQDAAGSIELLNLLNDVERRKQDPTYASTTHLAEVVSPHRRIIANYIALHMADHIYASAMQYAGTRVVNVSTTPPSMHEFVSLKSECATRLDRSRFQDYNYFSSGGCKKSSAFALTRPRCYVPYTVVSRVVAELRVVEVIPITAGLANNHLRRDLLLFERIRKAQLGVDIPPTGEEPPDDALFMISKEPPPGGGDTPLNVVPAIAYDPSASSLSVCGGGPENLGAYIKQAKQCTHFGPLGLLPTGRTVGWEALSTVTRAIAVHAENAGRRPFNGYMGPQALEKAWELGLPCATAMVPGEVQMAAHESDTHAHAFVSHVAQMCQPKLLVQIEWAPPEPSVPSWTQACAQIIDLAQAMGPAFQVALARFRTVPTAERIARLDSAFGRLSALTGKSIYAHSLEARAAMAPVKTHGVSQEDMIQGARDAQVANNNASEAVLVAGLASLIHPSIAGSWKQDVTSTAERVAARGGKIERELKLLCCSGGAAARAISVLFGYWLDLDAHGQQNNDFRAVGPFSSYEVAHIGTVRLAPAEEARIGFLRPSLHTATTKLLMLDGHTTVSLTEGHIKVLEVAAGHVLNAPSVAVSKADRADEWPMQLPKDAPRAAPHLASVKRVKVTSNTVYINHNAACATRKFVGLLMVEGEATPLFYRSVQVNSERRAGAQQLKRGREDMLEVDLQSHRFAPIYGTDFTRRFIEAGTLQGVAALAPGDDVVITTYLRKNPDWPDDDALREEVAHGILVARGESPPGVMPPDAAKLPVGFVPFQAPSAKEDGGRLTHFSPLRRAVTVAYTLATDEGHPRLDPLNAVIAAAAWPLQQRDKSDVMTGLMGQPGTGKSWIGGYLGSYIYGENTWRDVTKFQEEAKKQFGEEFSNTLVVWADEVDGNFFNVMLDSGNMKESITNAVQKTERKHENGRKKSPNTTSYWACSNDMLQIVKDAVRRLIRVLCGGGLRKVVGGRAAGRYFELAFGEMMHSPWGNAGVLHFLANYALPPSLETFTVGNCTMQDCVLIPYATQMHLKLLKWLAELPSCPHDDARRPLSLSRAIHGDKSVFLEEAASGWPDELFVTHSELQSIARNWHEFGLTRKERGGDGNVNPEASIASKLQELMLTVPMLVEMNAKAPPGGYRFTRAGLKAYLNDKGVRVVDSGPPYYEHV